MIGIIGFNNLNIMQYLYKYTEILEKNNIEYEVIFWNRDNENIEIPYNYIAFNYKLNTYKHFYKKIFAFLKYTKFLYKNIKKRKYEKLILLTTQTIIPLSPLILSKYKGKYIYDYRDITFEKYKLFKYVVNKLIKHSMFTSISSPGFIKKLGNSNKFVLSHNCNDFTIEELNKTNGEKVNIVYWGMIRQVSYNKKICDLFGNDKRFNIIYHGEGYYKELEEYCKYKKYINITFTGTYNLNEISKFAENTDILLNCYDNDEQQQLALTVKLYDGIRYNLPMLINKDSYMEEFLRDYNVSFSFDVDNIYCKDNIYDWIKLLNRKEIKSNYFHILNKIEEDNKVFEKNLIKFVGD